MTSLNSSPSTTTSPLQTQDIVVSQIQIQQLTEQIHQLSERNNQLNEQVSPKWWKSTKASVAYAVGLIFATATLMNQFVVTPIKETSEKRKDDIDRLEKRATTQKERVGDIQKSASGHNQNSQLDLLSTLISINRVYHDPVTKSVASALVLSKSAKDQLKKFPVKMVALNIEFQPGQDSVEFYIFDERQNKRSQKLLKKEGRGNPENTNERYFEIAAGSFSNVDPTSILEIRIESHGLKKDRNSASSFAIKSLVMQ